MIKDIHDNEIISYIINLKDHEIIFKTIDPNNEPVNIRFQETIAHRFENENSGSIILDIEKFEAKKMIEENIELLKETKDYGWPILYSDTSDLLKKLQLGKYNYYVIYSSYGLSGWVLAKKMDIN